MAAPKFNRERAARILIDAIELGDRKASERWKITDRTLRNYRARLASDPELSALVLRKGRAAEATWHAARASVLRQAADRAKALLEKEEDLDRVSRVVEVFGKLDMAASVLNVGTGADSGTESPEGSSGEAGEGGQEGFAQRH